MDRHQQIPVPPSRATAPGHAYFEAASSDFGLFHFIIDSVLAGDWVAYVADQALNDKSEYKALDPAKLAAANPGSRTRFLRNRRQILLEMFLSRLIDSFQGYLVGLIRLVLRSRPTMLSTSQQSLTLEELLKYGTIEELVHDVIERKVNALSYEGFTDLHAWCVDRGIPLNVSAQDRGAVVELIATRNVIAHNRGLIDDRYVRAVGTTRFPIGARRALEANDLFDALALFHRVVGDTDGAAIEKFGLNSTALVDGKPGDESTPPGATPLAAPTAGPDEPAAEQRVSGDTPQATRP